MCEREREREREVLIFFAGKVEFAFDIQREFSQSFAPQNSTYAHTHTRTHTYTRTHTHKYAHTHTHKSLLTDKSIATVAKGEKENAGEYLRLFATRIPTASEISRLRDTIDRVTDAEKAVFVDCGTLSFFLVFYYIFF